VCEGQQEVMYLKHVAKLIKDFPRKVVKFKTFIDLPHRLEKRYEEYDSVAIFDHDFNEVQFQKNIIMCDKLNKKLKPTKRKLGRHIYHGYSNVNFDLWLILHKENYTRSVIRTDSYVADVKRVFGLESIEDIKNRTTIVKILNQITLDDVKKAIKRAENIRKRKLSNDARRIGQTKVYQNPDFLIHVFLRNVLLDSGDLQ